MGVNKKCRPPLTGIYNLNFDIKHLSLSVGGGKERTPSPLKTLQSHSTSSRNSSLILPNREEINHTYILINKSDAGFLTLANLL